MYFSDAIRHFVPFEAGEDAEPLATLLYGEELQIKNEAIRMFWRENKLSGMPEDIVASPRERGYRTTSKRRLTTRDGRVYFDPRDSLLEPPEHIAIYKLIHTKLSGGGYYALSCALNWIIIRGTYEYRTVIFNVDHLDATIVRKLKQITKLVQESEYKVTAVHVYVDPSRSDYYLEATRPTDRLDFKQMYGPRELSLKLDGFSLRYPVTGFSQINESQVQNLLATAREMARLDKNTQFLDLYCGYGLFGLGIGEAARNVIGAEWEGPSVECAKASARHLKRNAKFIAGKIDARFVETALPEPVKNTREVILLDPPRKGCMPGVIEALASRNPDRVIHVFCGTDEIPGALDEWKEYGYHVKRIVPLDLFPGTAHLETMILLQRV